MDDLRYQVDMLSAMNKTYAVNEKIYKLICNASKKVFIYFNPETGLLKTYGRWNDYFDFLLNDYSDLVRTLDLLDDEYRAPVREMFFIEKESKETETIVALLKDKTTYVEITSTVRIDENGRVIDKLITFYDVTKGELLKKDLEFMAYYDLLTNLYNRNYYLQCLNDFLNKAKEEKTVVSILMINIDDFHKINDSLGIIFGDEVIQSFGMFLNSLTDNESIIGARFDGDIYSLAIFDPLGSKSVEVIYSKIKERLKEPFTLTNGSDIYLTVSIGVAEYPEAGSGPMELCSCAEIVMLKVKEAGKDNIFYYNSKVLSDFNEMVTLENKIKDAVRDKEFSLNYQPQFNTINQELRGVEALIRWQDKDGKFIPPGLFIPIAEKIGYIIPIGDWVLEEAVKDYMEWKKKYDVDFTLSINISSIQFKQNDFTNKVISILNKYDMRPENLELEITESVLIDEINTVFEKMEELRDFGMKISIDDFGTGYSSLSYLRKLPADTLKIDKSFIDTVITDEPTKIIDESIIILAKKLGYVTVAEGVETTDQFDYLKEANCDIIQGYLLGKPMSKDAIDDILLRMI